MRKIILATILFATLLSSCAEDKPKSKPFIVVDKQYFSNWNDQDYSYYTLQDGEGQTWVIEDTADSYKVGDTIK